MRVALVDPSLFTLPYDAALAGGLEAAGHEVVLHGRRPGRDDGAVNGTKLQTSFYRMAGSAAITALPKPLRLGLKGLDHITSMAALGSRLNRWQPNVIHFQWLPLPAVDRRFLPRLRQIAPLVLTVHDSNPFNGNPAAALQRRGVVPGFAQFDRIIVHTEQGRTRLLEQGLPEARIAVVPHGLLVASGANAATDDWMQNKLTFLLFGKLKPYKGADLLIDAFARLPAELRNQACVRIIGKPYMDLQPLHARAARHGIAAQVSIEPRFVGDDEVPALFGPDTIAVFPYREIEASGVLSLAIAYGRPILATRLGGFAETIEDGVHGALVAPEDSAGLSRAMAQLIADRRHAASCARAVRLLAGAIPEWSEIAKRTTAVYQAAGAVCG